MTDPPDEKLAAGPAGPGRRDVIVGAVTVASVMALGKPLTAEATADSSTDARTLTLTLQRMDISIQPVGEPFPVTLSAARSSDGTVTLDIPTIAQIFASSMDSPNFARDNFPTLTPDPPLGNKRSPYSYPKLPDGYPLGGILDTIDNAIPPEFRPTSGNPVTFPVASKINPGTQHLGLIDHMGRLQFSALEDYPLAVGAFATMPTRVSYAVSPVPRVTLENFQISPGISNSAKWNPADYPDPRGLHFDYGDYDDAQKGFFNGIYHTTWADNSAELPYNTADQPFKSYALGSITVRDFGRTRDPARIVNLSREPGGEDLTPNVSYAEGGVAIDPTNDRNLITAYQKRITATNGFVLSRSTDGGTTWSRKMIALSQPGNRDLPLDPGIPPGSSDIHLQFDRFGGFWLSYLHGKLTNTPAGFTGGPVELIYSADKGETFTHILSQEALTQTQVPAGIWDFYVGLDYPYLAIGPDATDPGSETVWMSIGDAIDGCAPNEYQQRVWGFRVKGLGVANIDLPSLRKYVVPSSDVAAYPSIDVAPNGAVVIAMRKANATGTYLELVKNNNRYWVNVLENGLADASFSEKRDFALVAIGNSTGFPPTPHNNYLGSGTAMIAIDHSDQHAGRVYAIYCNRPGINSPASKPYLTWSDDLGRSWSNPINVSTDTSPATATRPNIAIDPTSGVVALSWLDARHSPTNTGMHRYGAFLDPRELI